jgi:hypothetical protein
VYYPFHHFLAFVSFFAFTRGSSRSGSLFECVRALLRRPTSSLSLLLLPFLTFGDFVMLSLSYPLPSAYHLSLTVSVYFSNLEHLTPLYRLETEIKSLLVAKDNYYEFFCRNGQMKFLKTPNSCVFSFSPK